MRKNIIPLLILLCAIGCATKLEPGGAYSPNGVPDKPFMIADSAYRIAHGTCMTVFQYELDNRAALWAISRDIKHTLDKARPVFVEYNAAYLKARTTYKSKPTAASLDTLTGASQKIQQIATTIQSVMPSKWQRTTEPERT